ncbi:unnamed protein product [Owenia fusiformis]|uniref:Uncharacterized protein n=1 Tax=Owenia fusiformis TaxID=6347 RepID=A0A8J1UC84_OWEFU|nr:unnamed protein product [Owenia fusiformis]
MSAKRYIFAIWTDETEELAIRTFLEHCGITVKEAGIADLKQHLESENSEQSSQPVETKTDMDVDSDDNDPLGPPIFPPVLGTDECPHCFCAPCCTSEQFRQLWWQTETSEPHERNSTARKKCYKKFWVMLQHRGAWRHPRYVSKKQLALQTDARRNLYVYHGHRRDIMPDCIVRLVRGWLPNPGGIDYMGHLWD